MKEQIRILLVEDDIEIQEVVADYFHAMGSGTMTVECANDGIEGERLVKTKNYDMVLLDIMLPGMNGFQVCRSIREQSIMPIIFLTARGQEKDRLYGYSLGCDDYVVKPFSIAELYAKVQAVLKRTQGDIQPQWIQCGSIRLNQATFRVFVEDKMGQTEVELPPKQYALLKVFIENKGIVLSRDTLLNRVWGYDYVGNDRVVDNHIKKLRKALGTAGKQIQTVITQGYRMEA